jgi:septal ring factor EnvC (AmiA/AmiB activator)
MLVAVFACWQENSAQQRVQDVGRELAEVNLELQSIEANRSRLRDEQSTLSARLADVRGELQAALNSEPAGHVTVVERKHDAACTWQPSASAPGVTSASEDSVVDIDPQGSPCARSLRDLAAEEQALEEELAGIEEEASAARCVLARAIAPELQNSSSRTCSTMRSRSWSCHMRHYYGALFQQLVCQLATGAACHKARLFVVDQQEQGR